MTKTPKELQLIAETLNTRPNKKKIYHTKNSGDIVGVNIKPELPKNADIIINNDFKKTTDILSKELVSKIRAII